MAKNIAIEQQLPDSGGTYVLIIYVEESTIIKIGKKGNIMFNGGYYAYTGSAFGSGGLRARVGRHFRKQKKVHWHIDYLLANAILKECWYVVSEENYEHTFAEALSCSAGAEGVIERFGSSDCRCKSHLIYFGQKPSIELLKAYSVQSVVV